MGQEEGIDNRSAHGDAGSRASAPDAAAGACTTSETRTRRRAWIPAAGILVVAPLVGVEWITGPPPANPPVIPEHTIEANLPVPPAVSGLLKRACANCHSNETNWPWYSRVAPVSWLVVGDVNRARETVNFSEWSTGIGSRPEFAGGILAAACLEVQSGHMPLKRYRFLHPGANVTPQESQALCAWTQAEIARLAAGRRNPANSDQSVGR